MRGRISDQKMFQVAVATLRQHLATRVATEAEIEEARLRILEDIRANDQAIREAFEQASRECFRPSYPDINALRAENYKLQSVHKSIVGLDAKQAYDQTTVELCERVVFYANLIKPEVAV